MTRKRSLVIAGAAIAVIVGTGMYTANLFKTQMKEIFKYNGVRKTEGYYLAEFEFKMLGSAYYMDRGEFTKANSILNELHHQLTSTEGLIKVPEFKNDREELEFYLNQQNPRTGAFMDDSYPLFTWFGPTFNILALLEQLSAKVGEPLRLKYPLTFLDKINTPETLHAFLDDLATVGRIGTLFRTPYVCIAELNGISEELTRTGLYQFTPEWKRAFLQWFYDNQDPETGFWGARARGTGELLDGGDLVSTEKVVKNWVDKKGNNIYPEFPLRHKNAIFTTALEKLSLPMPEDLDDLHDWVIALNRGSRLLTRHLWIDATPANKATAKQLMEQALTTRYRHYYVEEEGAFSLYPDVEHADLDGTGEMLGYLDEIGSFSLEKQRRIWGEPNITELGTGDVALRDDGALQSLLQAPGVNSIRFYTEEPEDGNYLDSVVGVHYPGETVVPDLIDMLPNVTAWTKSTVQSMGNWVSREAILEGDLSEFDVSSVPVSTGDLPREFLRTHLAVHGEMVAVGYDIFQVPQCKLIVKSN
jgi:hypothetical protein